jgi:glutamate:GABA antiporter
VTCVLYAVPVLAIVPVVPADRLTGLTGFIDALAAVFVVYGPLEGLVGGLAALAFLWILVANGLTWVMASSRTQAAASLDGVGPDSLDRVSARTGTPVTATLAGDWSPPSPPWPPSPWPATTTAATSASP